MIFTSWIYGLFLTAIALVHWKLPARHRPWWLIGAGMAFYASWRPRDLVLLVACSLVVFATTHAAARSSAHRARIAGSGIAASLLLLAGFKYTGATEAPPLAISFFVFEFVHVLADVWKGTLAPMPLRDFLLFVFFFPTLVCGPIKRFQAFGPQADLATLASADEAATALQRIVVGLAKKLVIADQLAHLTEPGWQATHLMPAPWLWVLAYAYAAQIYFDFAGYSDIAIGSARLLGVRVPENFASPYLQPDIARFWRSWHMSLTTWITDYVYVPLGGNRLGAKRAHLNRVVAMGLCGLWHGAAGHFVVWGLFHGCGLVVHREWRTLRKRIGLDRSFGIPGRVFATIVTFHFVCLGWVFFRVDTVTAAGIVSRLLGLS